MKLTIALIALLSIATSWAEKEKKADDAKDKREAPIGYPAATHSFQAPSVGNEGASAISIGAGYSVGGAKPSYSSYEGQGFSGSHSLGSESLPASGHATIQLAPITLQPSGNLVGGDLSQLMSQLQQQLNSGALSLQAPGGGYGGSYQAAGHSDYSAAGLQEQAIPQYSFTAPKQQYSLAELQQSVPSYAAGTKGLGSYSSTGPVLFNPSDVQSNSYAPSAGHSFESSGITLGSGGHSFAGLSGAVGGSYGGGPLSAPYKSFENSYASSGKNTFKPSAYLGSSVQSDPNHGISALSSSYGAPSFGGASSLSGSHGALSLGSGSQSISLGSGHGASSLSGSHGALSLGSGSQGISLGSGHGASSLSGSHGALSIGSGSQGISLGSGHGGHSLSSGSIGGHSLGSGSLGGHSLSASSLGGHSFGSGGYGGHSLSSGSLGGHSLGSGSHGISLGSGGLSGLSLPSGSHGSHGGLSFGSGGHGASFGGSHGASFGGSHGGFGSGSPKYISNAYLPAKEGFGSLSSYSSGLSSPSATTYGIPSSSYSANSAHAASSHSPQYYKSQPSYSGFGAGSSSYRSPASSHSSLKSYPKYSSGGYSSLSSQHGSSNDPLQGAYSENSYNTIKYSQELKSSPQ